MPSSPRGPPAPTPSASSPAVVGRRAAPRMRDGVRPHQGNARAAGHPPVPGRGDEAPRRGRSQEAPRHPGVPALATHSHHRPARSPGLRRSAGSGPAEEPSPGPHRRPHPLCPARQRDQRHGLAPRPGPAGGGPPAGGGLLPGPRLLRRPGGGHAGGRGGRGAGSGDDAGGGGRAGPRHPPRDRGPRRRPRGQGRAQEAGPARGRRVRDRRLRRPPRSAHRGASRKWAGPPARSRRRPRCCRKSTGQSCTTASSRGRASASAPSSWPARGRCRGIASARRQPRRSRPATGTTSASWPRRRPGSSTWGCSAASA